MTDQLYDALTSPTLENLPLRLREGDGLSERIQAADEIERLREALLNIRVVSEFYAQDGVADYAARYAHESTKRLCDQVLSECGGNDGGKNGE